MIWHLVSPLPMLGCLHPPSTEAYCWTFTMSDSTRILCSCGPPWASDTGTGVIVNVYLSLRFGLNKTSSHRCDGIFQFSHWGIDHTPYKHGPLTVKGKLWLPTHNTEVVHTGGMFLAWSYMGEGSLRCSLILSSKVLADSPMYSSSHSTLLHLYLKIIPLFCVMMSLSLEATRKFMMMLSPLR